MPPRAQPDLRHLTDQYELTDAELAATCTAVMATHPPREDLWVFGYGSLMWKPEFPFLERHAAHVHGFHRSFCVYSHVYRGTRARPGLVLALDAGGSCRGVAYRVAADSAADVVERLVRREMVTRVYLPRWVPARLADGRRVRAHTYTAAHDHEQYAGKLAAEEAARIIRGGIGRSGHNVDYLRSTVAHLAELGIADRALVRIAGLLADTEEPLSAGGGKRVALPYGPLDGGLRHAMQEFRIAELEARHARLEDLLAQEAGRPKPDDSLLADLKRQKLRIKDKMAEMQRGS